MKKSLLLASMAMIATSAMAVTDGSTYQAVNGINLESKWIYSVNRDKAAFDAQPFAEFAAKARTATVWDAPDGTTKAVVAYSRTMVVGEESNDFAHLVFYDMVTGQLLKMVQMTVDGQAIKGLLCANSCGTDNYGHLWFCGYVATPIAHDNGNITGKTPVKVYKVDNWETGECSLAASVELPDDEYAVSGRIDYIDLNGDLTLTEAGCNIMAAPASAETTVYGWHAEQGDTEYGPLMAGGEYYTSPVEDTYPAGQTSWSTAPVTRIVYSEENDANLYYIDGNTTCPTMYDNEGAVIESFASASDLAPKVGPNGVAEFSLGDRNFVTYVLMQYDGGDDCKIRIAELGEGQSFDGMQEMWDIPANGLGEVSDGGTRVQSIYTKKFVDENGKEGAYLLDYKCSNGLAGYLVSEEGFNDPNQGGVNDIVVDDVNAPVEYFNLQGVRVAEPTPGLYITRQGKTVSKQIVK